MKWVFCGFLMHQSAPILPLGWDGKGGFRCGTRLAQCIARPRLAAPAATVVFKSPQCPQSIMKFTAVLLLSSTLYACALPGTFITDVCKSDADCDSGCCGFRTGKCAGPIVAQERDGGCGFGNAQPNANAAIALGFKGQPSNNANKVAVDQSPKPALGQQFITGACTSDADCKSGCCGFRSGKCAGPVIAQERDGGCGFGNAQPNADAARAFGFKGQPGQKP